MELYDDGFYAAGVDSEKRSQYLDVVNDAADPAELLIASCAHFNSQVSTLSADRILEEFSDEQLDADLQATVGFDPVLFKACALFELAHVEDEAAIADYVTELAIFWKGCPGSTKEDLELTFTAETKRARYVPFAAMSEYVVLIIASIAAKAEYAQYLLNKQAEDASPVDPLKEAIDGKEYTMVMGRHEIKFEDPPVLTRQLQKDLGTFLPQPIINELQDRFPDDGRFEDINPLIERIKHERANNLTPTDEEMIRAYRRVGMTVLGAAEVEEPAEEVSVETAKEYFMDVHRSLTSRMYPDEVYVPGVGAWYTIEMLESDTEHDVFYRRIYYGDLTCKNQVDVTEAERKMVLDTIDYQRQEISDDFDTLKKPTSTVHDVTEWPTVNSQI